MSRDHRASAQLHLHSGQLSINFDLKLLNSWESFTLLLFNHSTPNIYLFYYSSLERSHLPAKTRKIGHKILWIWATIKDSLYKENCSEVKMQIDDWCPYCWTENHLIDLISGQPSATIHHRVRKHQLWQRQRLPEGLLPPGPWRHQHRGGLPQQERARPHVRWSPQEGKDASLIFLCKFFSIISI